MKSNESLFRYDSLPYTYNWWKNIDFKIRLINAIMQSVSFYAFKTAVKQRNRFFKDLFLYLF